MPRQARNTPGRLVYHVLNRAVARLTIFKTDKDYATFDRVLAEAQHKHPIRLLGYCLMPNHWHLVLRPKADGDLTSFMRWATHTHVMRWHSAHRSVGAGPLYQDRFKAFPIENDGHLLTVCRYVEGNALRGQLVDRAEDWRWGSLWRRRRWRLVEDVPTLCAWPIDRPRQWTRLVNTPLNGHELDAVRQCVRRGCPYGSETWSATMVNRLKLEHTQRRPGRPRKALT